MFMTDVDPLVWILTGASGSVGRMLLRYWQNVPPKHIRIVPQYRKPSEIGLDWSPLDGPNRLMEFVKRTKGVTGLIVFSGVTSAQDAVLSDNSALVTAILLAARAAGINRVLVASSSAIYGAGDGNPLTENAVKNPVNDYGRAKLAAESVCAEFPDLDVCCLRIGNVAGADMLLKNGASTSSILKLDVFPNGEGPKRTYIGPETFARVLESLMGLPQTLPTFLNVGAPTPVAMEDLLSAANIPFCKVTAPPTALQSVTLDCTLLASLHKFEPAASLPATLISEWQALKDPT